MINQTELKEVGKFQKTHALKGELNAILDIDPDYMTDGNAIVVEVDGIYVPFYAESVRPKGSHSYLVKLDGVDSEEDARPFVNKSIYAIRKEIQPYFDMAEDEIIDEDDLVGFTVVDNESGEEIGKIIHIDSSTENVLLVVETPDGDEVFVPAVDDFINEIGEDSRIIRVSLPDGLIDLNIKTEKQ